MANVANVRNPRLVKSLKAALLALPNVTIREQCDVSGFVLGGGRVVGVNTATGHVLGITWCSRPAPGAGSCWIRWAWGYPWSRLKAR